MSEKTVEEVKLDQIIETIASNNKDVKAAHKNIYDKLEVLTKTGARIEERVNSVKKDLQEHESSDDDRFKSFGEKVITLEVDSEVAKRVSAKTGTKYGLAGGGGLIALVELIKAYFNV